MNFLFVNYGDFTSNSLNHIGAFANRLTLLGHACVVAVPEKPETIATIHEPLFTPATYARALEPEPIFPDRRPADIVHAWTPRENVREFTLAYLRQNRAAALLVHLEDNEVFLLESYAHESIEKLRALSDEELAARLSPRLSHPVRFKNFLRVAHAATYITDRLREFVPAGQPAHRLLPGIDPALYAPHAPDAALRKKIGVAPHEKLLVFTGSTNFATLADIRALLLAVRLINDTGTPCKLVRTGINPPELAHELAAIGGDHVIDLGWLEKPQLAPLLALADVLVQPGAADAFNDYRLPSKIPEFLCVGRPVILPRANLGREMEDGRHALLLETDAPAEIAEKCLRVFADPALAQRLAAGALEFARAHFDLATNTAALLAFYEKIKLSAAPIFTDPATPPSEDVLLAEGDVALRMRAKEQTIAYTRGLVAAREADLAARDATIAARDTTIAARETDIAALNGTIAALHTEKAVMVAQANYQHAKIQAGRNQVEVLRRELADAISVLKHLTQEFDAMKARAEAADIAVEAATARTEAADTETRQREEKIARMTSSFSWRATSLLRALRRQLVDPVTTKPQPAPPPPPPPATPIVLDPGLAYFIDEPASWDAVPRTGTLRGWVVTTDGAAIAGVRLNVAGQTYDAIYALTRPDVANAYPGHLHALQSGFVLDYALSAKGSQPIVLEALTADGRWRCFAAPAANIVADIPEHLRRDYATWVRRFDTPTNDQIVTLRARLESLAALQRPRLSVLMPTYNTPERWLVRTIESVRAQLYPNWELCIADDASTAPHVRRILDDYARCDERIKVTYRDQNGHISATSNSALALATGEFTALLDHDDEIPPHALAEVVLALAAQPDLEFIYSDEDKIDELGRRFDPYFKPEWNPDLLLGQNYTCHFSVFRTARLRAIGGFRTGLEGSQDWDLTLRATEGLDGARIHHIPRVLYHWRAIAGSTALVIDQKNNYPFAAAKKALADHLARTAAAAELVSVSGRYWRVKHPLPSHPPKVSIIIPTKNGDGLLRLCIGSILAKTTYPNFEIVVVNNRSDDPATLAYFEELRPLGVRVLDYDAPFNFSALNNFAARAVSGELLAFLNNDLEVITPGWLDEMAAQALRPGIGCVGAMLYYPDDTVQHAGAVLGLTGPAGRDGVAGHAFKGFKRGAEGDHNRLKLVQNYSAVTAACLVIRRKVFDAVGGFNERDLPVAFNDIDFCLRVRAAGYRNLWTPFAEFYHRESASRGFEDTAEKIARFQTETAFMRARWGPLLDRDPAYNPNLSLQHEDFSLAFPPRVS